MPGNRVHPEITLGADAYDDLQYGKALLSHALPSGDTAQVIGRALRELVRALEKQKFAAHTSRRANARQTKSRRHIPAAVKGAVFERDGGRCTFTGDDGHRCESRVRLEFDHQLPVARGGESTVDNVRLRCRAHNQHAAEQAFGAGFMDAKREAARREREAARRARDAAQREAAARKAAAAVAKAADAARLAKSKDVIAALRALGYRREQAESAARACEELPVDATLEQQLKHALRQLLPAHVARQLSLARSLAAAPAAACGSA